MPDTVLGLEQRVADLQLQLEENRQALEALTSKAEGLNEDSAGSNHAWPLTQAEYQRYGRQLILPEIGLRGALWCTQEH